MTVSLCLPSDTWAPPVSSSTGSSHFSFPARSNHPLLRTCLTTCLPALRSALPASNTQPLTPILIMNSVSAFGCKKPFLQTSALGLKVYIKQHVGLNPGGIFTVSICSDWPTAAGGHVSVQLKWAPIVPFLHIIRGRYNCVHVLVRTYVGISPFHTTGRAYPVPLVQARASCSSASLSDEY